MNTTSTTAKSAPAARSTPGEPSSKAAFMRRLLATPDQVAPLIARLTLAIVIFPHGAQKMLGWFGGNGFSGTMGYFTDSLGIPALFAFLAIIAEFFGPIALAAGALTRLAALGIGAVMFVAIFMGHASNGFFMNWYGNQAGEGFEYHLLAIGLALIGIVSGGGALSVDRAWASTNAK